MILSYNAPRIYSKTCGCYASQEGFFFCPLHAAAEQLLEALKEASQHFYGDMAPDFDYYSEHMYKAHKIIKAAIAAASPDSYQAEPEEHNG